MRFVSPYTYVVLSFMLYTTTYVYCVTVYVQYIAYMSKNLGFIRPDANRALKYLASRRQIYFEMKPRLGDESVYTIYMYDGGAYISPAAEIFIMNEESQCSYVVRASAEVNCALCVY